MRNVSARAERYAERWTSPPPELFARLAAETRASQPYPEMMVGPVEAAFLSFLVFAKRPQRVLEIGTFTGWSSVAMALALPPGGSLVSCDLDAETTAIAARYAEEAGVGDRVDYRVGPALETLAGLDGPFDLVFVDADKAGYVDYYEAVLPRLADGGLILADNTLAGLGRGDVAASIERFNAHVHADPRVECVLLTVRDGITLIRRRP